MTDHDPNPSSDLPHPLPPDPSSDDTVRVLSGPPLPSADTHGDPAGRPRAVLPLPVIEGYEVIEEIGRGGMGVVYCAKQLAAGGRVVALKVMLGEAFARPEELRRFEREVEIASGLNHPNIARIYDSGLTHGSHYFAMEYIDGLPLDLYCKTRALRIDDRLQLFTTVCEAVACAHRRGIIHRDLKPSNILVDVEGNPHVLDFGLAKTHADDDSAERRSLLTIDGTVLGTLPYMAPEQAEGHTSAIDTRTDVYALGVILYELLTGKFPYEVTGQMAEVLKRIAEAEPKRPSTVNRLIGNEVETIILRALHKAPDRRYTGADDLARDVARFLAHEPIEAKRDSGWYVLRKTMRRHRVPVAVVLSVVILIAVAAVTSFALYRRAEAQRKEAEIAKAEEQRQRGIAQTNERNAVASKKEAEISQQKASASEKEVTHRLALQFFNEGIGWWFDRQDATKASACFAEALRVSPEPFPAARMALNNAMKQCPQMSRPPVAPPKHFKYQYVNLSADGKRALASGSGSRDAEILDTTTGQPISPRIPNTERLDPNMAMRLLIEGTTARVLDAISGKPVSVDMQHGKKILATVCSLNGERLATLADDKTVRVWDIATGQPVSPFISLNADYESVVLSPDGKRLAANPAEEKKTKLEAQRYGGSRIAEKYAEPLRIWDVESGQMISNVPNFHLASSYMRENPFSPDGKLILTASSDSLQIMEVDTWKPVSAPMKIPRKFNGALLGADGKRVLMFSEQAARDKTAQVWDATTGQPLFTPMERDAYVGSTSFSPDGRWVVTTSRNCTVRMWDASTGLPVFAPIHDQPSHGGAYSALNYGQATFTADMKHLMVSYGIPRVWDLPTEGATFTTIHCAGADGLSKLRSVNAEFSPDGTRVLTESRWLANGWRARVGVWDSNTGLAVSVPGHSDYVAGNEASFTPDGNRVVIYNYNPKDDEVPSLSLWDAITGQRVSHPIQTGGSGGITDPVSKDAWVIVPKNRRGFEIWDAATGKLISSPKYNGSVWGTSFSPDRQQVATASEDGTARVWDATTGQPVSAPMKHDATVRSARFSPDGKRIVTASDDTTARVWDATTGQPLSPPMKQHSGVRMASFSPDGSRIVTTLNEGTVRVWDAFSGLPISALMRHQMSWVIAAFSPDGRWVITSALCIPDGTDNEDTKTLGEVRLWDAKSGQPVSAPMHEGSGVGSIEFSPDGKRALVGTRIGVVRIWTIDDVDWDEPIDLIQARVRARLGVAVASTGDVQALSTEDLAAAWRDYQRLQADYEQKLPEIAPEPTVAPAAAPPAQIHPFPFTLATENGALTITKYTGLAWDVIIPTEINGLPVTGIGAKAFSGNPSLLDVTIPVTVSHIGDWAFGDCVNLTSVRFNGDPPRLGQDVFQNTAKAIVYHMSGTTGWGKEFAGRPTAVWDASKPNQPAPPAPQPEPKPAPKNPPVAQTTPFTAPVSPGEAPVGYKLVWADEFDGANLDTTKWGHDNEGTGSKGSLATDAVTVANGMLAITIYTEDGRHSSGIVSTRGKFERRMGYCEARIKFPNAAAISSLFKIETGEKLPAVWDRFGSGGNHLAIRASQGRSFSRSNENPVYAQEFMYEWNCLWNTGRGFTMAENARLAEGFHVYGFMMDENRSQLYIDGKLISDEVYPLSFALKSLVLSAGVEKQNSRTPPNGYGTHDASTTKMEVDYVRFYEPTGGGISDPKTQGDYTYVTNSAGQATVIAFNRAIPGDIIIPDSLAGAPVTAIGALAFSGCARLKSISLPTGINQIGSRAFGYCMSLGRITIPAGVTVSEIVCFGRRVSDSPFYGCLNLEEFTVDSANATLGSRDGALFDKAQTSLILCPPGKQGYYTVPAGVARIESSAFSQCRQLTAIALPASFGAFAGKTVGLEFADCTSLAVISVDSANTNFSSLDGDLFDKGRTALLRCPPGKTGDYDIPAGVTRIGDGAFSRCENLISITVPASTTHIGRDVFGSCTKLTRINFKGNMPALSSRWNVFGFGKNLTLYYLPGTTGWGKEFGGRPTVVWDPKAAPQAPPTPTPTPPSNPTPRPTPTPSPTPPPPPVPTPSPQPLAQLSVPDPAAAAILKPGAAVPISTAGPFTYTTENRSVTITQYTGQGANVVIPDQINGQPVTGIGEKAFMGCANLLDVTIPVTVTSMGGLAFSKCPNLTGVRFIGNAPVLGQDVFQDSPKATIYYLTTTTGWGKEFGGRPTAWDPNAK